MKQYNIIMDVLGGGKSNEVLHDMQRAALSGTLNIALTHKVAT